MEPPLAVSVVEAGERQVRIRVVGELDLATAPILEAALQDVGMRDVTLDLAGLEFIDSSGISVLVAAHRRLEEVDRRLALRRCSDLCRRALQIAGLDDLLHFER